MFTTVRPRPQPPNSTRRPFEQRPIPRLRGVSAPYCDRTTLSQVLTMKTKLAPIMLCLSVLLPSAGRAELIKYGQVFRFEPAQQIEFPDFHLQFIGRKPNVFYPGSTSRRLGDVYEFGVSTPTTSQVIRWSSGTGEIGPEVFEVQGKCFWLELHGSDRFGRLEENQAVVSLDSGFPTSCKRSEGRDNP